MTDPLELRYQALLDRNKNRIYRICRHYAVAPLDATDLFQEVLFQLWRALPAFAGNSSIDTWVYRITLNTCYGLNAKQNKHNSKTVQLEGLAIAAAPPSWSERDQARYNALQTCIASLADLERSLIILVLDELPYKQIADITGLTENHIAVKVKRIKALLLRCLSAKLAT